jgi:hypothetical protein
MAAFDHGRLLERMRRAWNDGERLALGWTATADALRVLMVERATFLAICRARPELWSDRRFRSPAALRDLAAGLTTSARLVEIVLVGRVDAALHARMERLVARFTITLRPRRPVALVDLVGFSKRGPLDQLVQLTGLEQALCRAEASLAIAGFGFAPMRTTTGDGFYLWDPDDAVEDPARLLALVLATFTEFDAADLGDGVDARLLKATLGVGACFTFHRVAARMPRDDTFVVGAVTVELARLMNACAPGQILLGTGERHRRVATWQTAIAALNRALGGPATGRLRLRASLTGAPDVAGVPQVARLTVRAKHGWTYPAINLVAAARRADDGPGARRLGHRRTATAAKRERRRQPPVGPIEEDRSQAVEPGDRGDGGRAGRRRDAAHPA